MLYNIDTKFVTITKAKGTLFKLTIIKNKKVNLDQTVMRKVTANLTGKYKRVKNCNECYLQHCMKKIQVRSLHNYSL